MVWYGMVWFGICVIFNGFYSCLFQQYNNDSFATLFPRLTHTHTQPKYSDNLHTHTRDNDADADTLSHPNRPDDSSHEQYTHTLADTDIDNDHEYDSDLGGHIHTLKPKDPLSSVSVSVASERHSPYLITLHNQESKEDITDKEDSTIQPQPPTHTYTQPQTQPSSHTHTQPQTQSSSHTHTRKVHAIDIDDDDSTDLMPFLTEFYSLSPKPTHVCMYVCMYVYICMYVCMYVCL